MHGVAVAQHLIFDKAKELQHLELLQESQEGNSVPPKQTKESTVQDNVAAGGAKIFLKIYPGKPGDMPDTTTTSIYGL